jgi:NAD(P)-dependent dehydrogenase (short-subunit alcohol dehydrogenase family)
MDLTGRHIIVTGSASGIGRAMALRFAAEGAKAVVVADRDAEGAGAVAAQIGGLAVPTDVSQEADIQDLIATATKVNGPIDLFCSNAGIGGAPGGPDTANEGWDQIWHINVMAHVWAARALLPDMLARGHGYLLNTASAAGLLTNLGNLQYSVSKHAAVAVAEWLSMTYGNQGIKVSCLCPQGVRTPMLMGALDDMAGSSVTAAGGVLEPEEVADSVVEGIQAERFFILPHPEVAGYMSMKANDPERWLAGMRRMQARLASAQS